MFNIKTVFKFYFSIPVARFGPFVSLIVWLGKSSGKSRFSQAFIVLFIVLISAALCGRLVYQGFLWWMGIIWSSLLFVCAAVRVASWSFRWHPFFQSTHSTTIQFDLLRTGSWGVRVRVSLTTQAEWSESETCGHHQAHSPSQVLLLHQQSWPHETFLIRLPSGHQRLILFCLRLSNLLLSNLKQLVPQLPPNDSNFSDVPALILILLTCVSDMHQG